MSEGIRIPYSRAKSLADSLVFLLEPLAQRIEILGSIRRLKPDIGDIELLIEPRYDSIEQRDLFGATSINVCCIEQYVEQCKASGSMTPRLNSSGHAVAYPKQFTTTSRYLAVWWTGNDGGQYKLDLFIIRPDRLTTWGWQQLLRTGPSDCNKLLQLPAHAGIQEGVNWYSGLKLPSLQAQDGVVYQNGTPLILETEQQVYEAYQMNFVPPQERTLSNYIAARQEWRKGHGL